MVAFLIILAVILLLWRYGYVILEWYIRRRMRKIFGNAQNPFRAADEAAQRSRGKGGWSNPTPKRKKFSKADGEYVKFTEVTVTQETTTDGATTDGSPTTPPQITYIEEQQITDAEWEDIP